MTQLRLGSPVLLACLTIAALSGCGGTSDKDQINSIVTGAGSSPASLCDHMATGLLARFGGLSACRATAGRQQPDSTTHAKAITITGSSARVVVVDRNGSHDVSFVKQNGAWKLAG